MPDTFFLSPPRKDWQLRARANFKSKDAAPVEAKKARQEWLRFAERLEALEGQVIVLGSPDSLLTGMPFAAEAGVMLSGPRFLLPRMAAPHRQGEAQHWQAMCEKLHIETVALPGGCFEGQGDVAELLGVTLVFHGGRSDREGAEDAAALIEGETILVEIREPAFHGNMALLPLAHARCALVCREVIAEESLSVLHRRFGHEALVPITLEEMKAYSTNALPVGDVILAPDLVPDRIAALYASLGYKVERLDMAELCGKAGGASRCLVCRSDAKIAHVPPEHTLSHFRAEIQSDR
jgi:N-dimethylarginine dimethylaminohydrolase